MAVNDIYLITLEADVEGVTVVNTFTYRALQTTTTANIVYAAFVASVIAPLLAILNQAYSVTKITVKNLNSLTDFSINTFSGTLVGEQGGNAVSSSVAIRFSSATKNLGIRGGQKRFAPTSESVASGNFLVTNSTTFNDALDAVETALNEWLITASIPYAEHIIVKRTKTVDESGTHYELPAVATGSNYYRCDNWQKQYTLSSQSSRKNLGLVAP